MKLNWGRGLTGKLVGDNQDIEIKVMADWSKDQQHSVEINITPVWISTHVTERDAEALQKAIEGYVAEYLEYLAKQLRSK